MGLYMLDSALCVGNLFEAINSNLSIKGKVSEKNTPIPCRIRLFNKASGRLYSEVLSNRSGEYEFNNLPPKLFFLVAHHPQNQFNAVIQDNVVPK